VPPPALVDDLPPNFHHFTLRCVATEQGRCFYPWAGTEGYLATAFAGGVALVSNLYHLSAEERSSYRVQYLMFQRARKTRDHLGNQLGHSDCLRLRRSGRGLENRTSLLPEDLGLDGSGPGKPWSLDKLLNEGWKEANSSGVARPNQRDCIRFGFLRAARLNPLFASDPEVPGLIRTALFDSTDSPAGGRTVEEMVLERALEAMGSHMGDSTEDFNEWCWGPNNTFVSQLAQRKSAPGGAMERGVVRQALLDQGWEAYRYVADCVHTMLFLFRRLLPVPLDDAENRLFERMHLKQPFFGELTSLMLAERFPQLYPVLEDVWTKPDNREHVAVMHRLLSYYGTMAPQRRAADRLGKTRKAGTKYKNQTGVEVELPPPEVQPDSEVQAATSSKWEVTSEDIADLLRAEQSITCGCSCPRWDIRSDNIGEDEVVITLFCKACSFETSLVTSLLHLRHLADS
jgi:hypothetical protein